MALASKISDYLIWAENSVWKYNAPLVLGGKDTETGSDDMNGRDVLCFGGDHVYVVAHILPAPIPPAAPDPSGFTSLIDSIIVGLFIGAPILFTVVVIPLQAYRKRTRK